MNGPYSQSTIDIIKATAPVVEEHGLAITKRFYENLFENHPYVNQYFNKSHVFPENGGISPQVRNNLILFRFWTSYVSTVDSGNSELGFVTNFVY